MQFNTLYKYISFLLLISFFTTTIFAQEKSEEILKVKKTEKHISFPGTQFSIIPPDSDFFLTDKFTGIADTLREAAINITELPMSYEMMLPMFTKDLPPKNGDLLIDRELVINDFQARLFKLSVAHKSAISKLTDPESEASDVIQWLLLFGNEEICITIAGGYPLEFDEKLSSKMEASLLSFFYDANLSVDPQDALEFKFDLEGSPLKFADVIFQTGAIFTTDGAFPSESEDALSLMVTVFPHSVPAEEWEETSTITFENEFKAIELKEKKEVEIAGLKGYEVWGLETIENDVEELIYITTLFAEDKMYNIRGGGNGFDKSELEDLQKVVRTLSFK